MGREMYLEHPCTYMWTLTLIPVRVHHNILTLSECVRYKETYMADTFYNIADNQRNKTEGSVQDYSHQQGFSLYPNTMQSWGQ